MNNTLFPSLSPQPNEVLYIIGNGFDISHSIESRYSDFEKWVRSRNNQRLIDMMDIFFSNKQSLWADIETALGEYDEESILDFCRSNENIDYDHPMRSIIAIEDAPNDIVRPILDEFLESFQLWVNSIDIMQAQPIETYDQNSLFLTFNYTETLEKVYNIPQQQILHIHGSRLIDDDNYIIGHNSIKQTDLYDTENGGYLFEQEAKNKIIGLMNGLHKDTTSIIRHNKSFFISMKNINHVVIKGHSLYEVDWPYFDEVYKNIKSDAQWIFNYYTREDYERMKNYIEYTGIKNYRFI